MSRKPVIRSLPPLASLFPEFSGFSPEANQRHELEMMMSKAARSLMGRKRMPFYSMREVGQFFGIPLKSVSVIFERLSKEGYLTIVRGSQTYLEGRRQVPKASLRGVVGIPVALPSFVYGSNPRRMYIRLEELLRRHSYVVDFIFYSIGEENSENLLERLLSHDLDLALWVSPASSAKENILRLHDAGVNQMVVADGPGMLPFQAYEMSLQGGFEEAARGWWSAGLRKVALVGPARSAAKHFQKFAVRAFSRLGFELKELRDGTELFFQHCQSGDFGANCGLVFLEHFHYEMLCNYDWRRMLDLMSTHRCLLAQGLVYHPAFVGREVLVDSLSVDFDHVASSLCQDIVARAHRRSEPVVFRATWKPGLNLAKEKRDF